MPAMRAAAVQNDPQFDQDLTGLRAKYPEIDDVIDELRGLLVMDYDLPEVLVDPASLPGAYAVKLDYPPRGAAGRGVLLLTYHGSDWVSNPMNSPVRTYTLLTLIDLG